MKTFFYFLILVVWGAPTFAGLDSALDISSSAVVANSLKMKTHASNIANVDTTQTTSGLPYRRQIAVYRAKGDLKGVEISQIAEDPSPLNKVYDPSHPSADPQGFVYYPNVDLASELIDLDETSGTFQTNVTAFNITKAMMQSSLEIGR
jgi:flagellar basal-body rod protein FlgC